MASGQSSIQFPSNFFEEFPILNETVNGKRLIYLDNAATTQTPSCVVERILQHYLHDNANVHRATHTLSNRSTIAYENAREGVARYLNAPSADCIVFTRGTTDSINVVAQAWAYAHPENYCVAASALEHHSNFVPWQQHAKRLDGNFYVIPLDDNGDIELDSLEALLSSYPINLIAVAHVSNVLGTVSPIKSIVACAHRHGAKVLVDAAQSIRHERIDVQDLDCDFLAFSGHKTLGPTGIGVLYGKKELLDELPPTAFGGEMVDTVRAAATSFERAPIKFEAGTPNYVGAIGLNTALEFIERIGRDDICQYEHALIDYAQQALSSVPLVQILGLPRQRAGCISFSVEGVHSFDLSTLMDAMGVAVRSGTQCAQPLLSEAYDIERVTRISPAFYNSFEEIDICIDALEKAIVLCRRNAV